MEPKMKGLPRDVEVIRQRAIACLNQTQWLAWRVEDDLPYIGRVSENDDGFWQPRIREGAEQWADLVDALIAFGSAFLSKDAEFAAAFQANEPAYIGRQGYASFHRGVYDIANGLHWCVRLTGDPKSETRRIPKDPQRKVVRMGFVDPKHPQRRVVRVAMIAKHWFRVCRALKRAKWLETISSLSDARPMIDREAAAVARNRLQLQTLQERKTTKRKTRKGHLIPPEKRTRPLSLRRAAVLIGKTGSQKDAAEWLRRSIEDGSYQAERVTRQSWVFNIDAFPAKAHSSILPQVAATGGKRR